MRRKGANDVARLATPQEMKQWIQMRREGPNNFDLDRIEEAVGVAEEDESTWRRDAEDRVTEHFTKKEI